MTESKQDIRAAAHHAIPWLGTVVLAAGSYTCVRWAPSPVLWTTVFAAAVLGPMSVCAYRGVVKGHAAPYVVAAVVMPTLLVGALGLGTAERVEAEVRDMFEGLFPGMPLLPPDGS